METNGYDVDTALQIPKRALSLASRRLPEVNTYFLWIQGYKKKGVQESLGELVFGKRSLSWRASPRLHS